MAIPAGSYTFGPDNARLAVHTERTGAAAKAGHNLLIEVGSWQATLTIDGDVAGVEVSADGGSLRVLEGTGGMQALGDDDKADIKQTIDDEVLKGEPISFRSTAVEAAGEGLQVAGELTLRGQTHPLAFEVAAQDGTLTASAQIRQSDWGMKPYSALFGALKVVDEVIVSVEATLPEDRA
jgi:polyisoprenoid-binding protein YceI